MAEDQIDAAVSSPLAWIFIPKPDVSNLGRPLWIRLQEPFDEALELLAPFGGISVEGAIEVGELRYGSEIVWWIVWQYGLQLADILGR